MAAQPDLRDKEVGGFTALMAATLTGAPLGALGAPEVVELLVDSGAQLDIQNRDGRTALWCAAQGNHPAVVRLLVDRGADQTIKAVGQTPREYSVKKGAALLR